MGQRKIETYLRCILITSNVVETKASEGDSDASKESIRTTRYSLMYCSGTHQPQVNANDESAHRMIDVPEESIHPPQELP
jgi:hypothetical protein